MTSGKLHSLLDGWEQAGLAFASSLSCQSVSSSVHRLLCGVILSVPDVSFLLPLKQCEV